jgi:polyhydroxybutyrate depolymerase
MRADLRIRTPSRALLLLVLGLLAASACTAANAGDRDRTAATLPAPGGDAGKTFASGLSHVKLPIGGTERSYRLFVPDTAVDLMQAGQRVPLLLAFHGALDTNDNLARADHTEALAQFRGFVVAHPMGLPSGMGGGAWNAGGCCSGPAKFGTDDVAFVRALIDDISSRAAIEPNRVYAVGHSNGGMLAYRLACELSDRIAAAGSVGGTLEIDECRPSRSVPFLHVHGRNDTIVPFGGGRGDISDVLDDYAFHSVEHSIGTMREVNGCGAEAEHTTFGTIEVTTWACRDGSQVRLAALDEAGHIWPPGVGVETPYGNDGGYNATKDFWTFFAAHARR